MGLDEARIEQIVEIVVSRLQQEKVDLSSSGTVPFGTGAVTDGVFQEMEACIKAATAAQKKLVALPLAVREEIIKAIRQVGLTQAELQLAHGQLEQALATLRHLQQLDLKHKQVLKTLK